MALIWLTQVFCFVLFWMLSKLPTYKHLEISHENVHFSLPFQTAEYLMARGPHSCSNHGKQMIINKPGAFWFTTDLTPPSCLPCLPHSPALLAWQLWALNCVTPDIHDLIYCLENPST